MSDTKTEAMQTKGTKEEVNPSPQNPALTVTTQKLPIKHEFAEDQTKKKKTNDDE